MHPGIRGGDGPGRVKRVRRGNQHGLDPGVTEHRGGIGERTNAEPLGKRLGPFRLGIANGNELRLGQGKKGLSVDSANLAAADQGGSKWRHGSTSYRTEIRQANLT